MSAGMLEFLIFDLEIFTSVTHKYLWSVVI
ncbi:uncharacterized protein ARMOST_10109 [Armillaria ostoyae]|uniref:Uncharacterized protein n=1 Tax=Armillaria ostoyae TaxID=47428 RepID=A0A284RDC0_ARMOS|nr:uncharacterized protein ARMOST_10109 [Armillaria ostoyae]